MLRAIRASTESPPLLVIETEPEHPAIRLDREYATRRDWSALDELIERVVHPGDKTGGAP
jgi:hypothetical protein